MFSIGEFSKITGLTVKTLRFYHEEGLSTPSFVDMATGYRHYNVDQIETARAILNCFIHGETFLDWSNLCCEAPCPEPTFPVANNCPALH